MPLYAQHRLVFGRFYRLDEVVRSSGTHLESGCRFLHCLVMETIHVQSLSIVEYAAQQTLLFHLYGVRGITSVQLLIVLDAGCGVLCMYVLVEFSP